MAYRIEFTRQYLKDLKLARKRGLDEKKLIGVITKLTAGEPLEAKYRDHVLVGNYKSYRECHISPDWLLIYSKQETFIMVTLMRTGTHSDLFL